MRGRRIWALLAVAAVLAVHGVQCVGGAVDSAHATVAAPVPLGLFHGALPQPFQATDHGGAPGATALTPVDSTPGVAPVHGADLWTVCLAVLGTLAFVGMAVLIRGGPASLLRGPPPRTGLLRRPYRPVPAPDLAGLCLLRI